MAKKPFEVFEDKAGEYRWRLVAKNGQILGTSGEGYTNKQGAEKSTETVIRLVVEAAELENFEE